jgi:hypothetical protein
MARNNAIRIEGSDPSPIDFNDDDVLQAAWKTKDKPVEEANEKGSVTDTGTNSSTGSGANGISGSSTDVPKVPKAPHQQDRVNHEKLGKTRLG